jgi:hypothetical protein
MMTALEQVHQAEPEYPRWLLVTVEEKFGELRVIVSPRAGGEVERPLQAARDAAKNTCDICGKIGSIRRDGGCFRVRCDGNADETYLAGISPVE